MPVITIRGIGLDDFGATNSPSAGVYVDQVYVASIAMMAFDMYDLERIEVLKGPQGTLYGRNSTAGAINIITASRSRRLRGAYATPATATTTRSTPKAPSTCRSATRAALRFSGKTVQQGEGYWDSRLLPGETIGERDIVDGSRAARARSRATDVDVNLKVEGLRSRSEMGQPEFFGTVNPLTGGPCAPILAGHIDNTQCTDFLRLHRHRRRSVPRRLGARCALRHRQLGRDVARSNADLGESDAHAASPATWISIATSTSTSMRRRRARSTSSRPTTSSSSRRSCAWRARAASGRLDRRRVLLATTRSASSIPGDHDDLFATRTLVTADQDTKSAAAFANGEWHLTDTLDLVTGLRYTWEDRQLRRRHDRSQSRSAFSCLLSPTCSPGFVGPVALTFVDDDDRRSQLVVARRARVPAASSAADVRERLARQEERRLLLRHLDHEPAARAVRARRAHGLRSRLQAQLRRRVLQRRASSITTTPTSRPSSRSTSVRSRSSGSAMSTKRSVYGLDFEATWAPTSQG